MNTLKRAASLAAVTVLALGIAACDDSEPDDPEPTKPAVSIAIPERFSTDPSWGVTSDLPVSGSSGTTTVSPSGTHYAYAQRDSSTITVGQLDLSTGEQVESSIEALEPTDDGTNGHVSLFYSGNRLVLAQSGASASDGPQWRMALFPVGSSADPQVLTENVEDGASITLPSPVSGPIVSVAGGEDSSAFMVNAASGNVREYPLGEKTDFEGCGDDANCAIALTPAVQHGGTSVGAFREQQPPGATACSGSITGAIPDERSGFDYCLSGFMTEKWSSQDPEVAPAGAIPESANIYAAGDGYLVGSWRGEDGGTIYRTININEPGASHAVAQCDWPQGGRGSHILHRSPSGQYFAAGSLLFDTHSGEGRCLDEGIRAASVSNSGTAWGAYDESWSPGRYASSAVSMTMDGTVTPEGDGVGVPVSFVSSNGVEAGAFAVEGDVLDGATVVATYPFKS